MCRFIVQTTIYKALGDNPLTAYLQAVLSGIPLDIRNAIEVFELEGKSTIYAVCPKCHTTYAPDYVGQHSIPLYKERCTFRRYGSRCGELLVRPKTIQNIRVNVPIKPYVVFDFTDWMSGLLARPGYEEMMDGAWERMKPSADGTLKDIFQGSIIREFKGPDGKTHFSLSGGEGTGRYLFSLGFDFFNPLGNKISGKKVSNGVISLVCVNFPMEVRYKPENMFLVGIPPGPREPQLDQINPYLRPIVDIFERFWQGVRFTRTFLYALGRLVLCALILVICDLPAARKVGGFSGPKQEYFCSVCWCNQTQHGYKDIDHIAWERRTNEECRNFAERYRSATNEKAAASSFDRTGLRWSELLRLPYYDPTRFLVVDPMHNLFLGLIKEHFQGILGYYPPGSKYRPKAVTHADIHINIPLDPLNPPPEGKKTLASVRKLIRWLEEPLDFNDEGSAGFKSKAEKWGKSSVHIPAFVYVGRGLGCLPSTMDLTGRDAASQTRTKPSKFDLAKRVLTWVDPSPLLESFSILNPHLASQTNIYTPSEIQIFQWQYSYG
jgi:hypothetical protein